MEKINLTNTNAGLIAIQRAMAGEDIIFTKLEIGDGVLVNTDVGGYTGLINKTKDFPLAAVKAEESEIIRLRSNISNHGVTQDLLIREYGIYAKFGNEQEFLFAYLNVGDTPTPLPNQTVGRYELNRDFILYIGNSLNVDFTSNGGVVYATLNDLKKLEKNLNRESLFNYIFDKPNYSPNPELNACRIPGLAITNKGTLLAVCDLRAGFNDIPNKIKIGLRKSYDQGNAWTDTQVIMNLGDSGTQGISDPCIVHNPETGRTFCFALNTETGNILNPSTNWGFYMTYSDDDGETWSSLRNLSALAPSNFRIMFQGPGNGCTYRSPSGTNFTIIPIQCWQGTDGSKSRSGIMYSTDNGLNWTVSSLVDRLTSECAVTVYNEKLYLTAKDESYKYGRFLYESSDMGRTWTEIIQDSYSTSTQGSLITIKGEDTTSVMVKCENNGLGEQTPRTDMTIKVSEDGMIWKEIIQVRDANGLGYSSMSYDDKFLYIHYETSNGCAFKRFPILLFKDRAVKTRKYDSEVLLNPKPLDKSIYIQDSTEVIQITNGNLYNNAIEKIYNSRIGKRIKIIVIGGNNTFKIKTKVAPNEKYIITDVRIGADKELILRDGDNITLYMTERNQWIIEDSEQFVPYRITGESINSNENTIDLDNYFLKTVSISGSCVIKRMLNVSNRGEITFVIEGGDVVLDLGSAIKVDGDVKRRVILNTGSSFKLSSYRGQIASITTFSTINQFAVRDYLKHLLEYDPTTKSINLFDNINTYIFEIDLLTDNIEQIRLNSPMGSVKFYFWVANSGRLNNKQDSTATKEGYHSIFIPTTRGVVDFTTGSAVELFVPNENKVTAIKY